MTVPLSSVYSGTDVAKLQRQIEELKQSVKVSQQNRARARTEDFASDTETASNCDNCVHLNEQLEDAINANLKMEKVKILFSCNQIYSLYL